MFITDKVIVSFWDKVDKQGPNDCWEWQGANRGNGYGAMKLDEHVVSAHRIAWTIMNGEIPTSLLVCHHCDNKTCVNPKHLFLGTQADNMRDAYRKGRITLPANRADTQFQKGERHPGSKLTDNVVLDIRQIYQGGSVTYRDLSKYYDVDRSLIYQIVKRKKWTHI